MAEPNWSEKVEDLVAAGDTEAAISFLETLVSDLEAPSSDHTAMSSLQLPAALAQLADLYSSKGFTLKSDELRSRSTLLKHRALRSSPPSRDVAAATNIQKDDRVSVQNNATDCIDSGLHDGTPVDDWEAIADCHDWEAIADRDANELLSPGTLPDISSLSVEETIVKQPKRRGRGTFTYKRDEMQRDWRHSDDVSENAGDHDPSCASERTDESQKCKHGTRHVLVLANFSPSTRTIDLETHFEEFKDQGFNIRWVNDTTALAVFRSPSVALEASNRVRLPFTVRMLDDDDILLDSISSRDLEPPCPRPKTSARTAQRLIAQGIGMKLPSSFGSSELRNQEDARRSRIITRQKLRDDAWGSD